MTVSVATHQSTQVQRVDTRNVASHRAPQTTQFGLPSAVQRLHRTVGNRAMNSLLRLPSIQPKLSISQPGDQYEREADRVADDVMRMPEPQSGSMVQRAQPMIQRRCTECDEEAEKN